MPYLYFKEDIIYESIYFTAHARRGKTDEEILAVRKSVVAGIKSDFTDETIEIVVSFFEGAPVDAKPYLLKVTKTPEVAE